VQLKNGIIDYKAQEEAFNSENFYDFLTSLIHILHEKAIYSAVFIMDNVPFHKVEQIKTFVVSKGHRIFFFSLFTILESN
ncbi:hypothetical protein H312_02807, partial [Anncaliia algerae PRA339]